MTQRSRGLPSPEQVLELLNGEFARSGYEVEDVAIDLRATPPLIRVIVDGDVPLDLDTVAELSRSASALLDDLNSGDATDCAYVLEVTSPGVDRPLTQEKHFRRARGRKVEAHLRDDTTVTGRVATVADGAVDLVVRQGRGWAVRHIPLDEIVKAVVQVEFSPPSAQELEFTHSMEAQS